MEVFTQPQRFLVPLFQRPYVWNEERQWEPLWRDVERLAERVLTSGNTTTSPHFLGAVVLQQLPNVTGELQGRIIVDGQQRLTTLQLLMDAIHGECMDQGFNGPARRLELLIQNQDAYQNKPEDQFKVWPTTRDKQAFYEVMAPKSKIDYTTLKHSSARLVLAHRYFAERTREWLMEAGIESAAQRAEALDLAVRTLLQIVVIDLQIDENAQEIFETLNARGTPLTPVDLIKNLVFQRLLDEDVDVEKIYDTSWRHFETEFWEKEISSGRLKRPMAVVFFHHWLMSVIADEIPANEVFSAFKRYLVNNSSISIQDIVQRIYAASQLYADFTVRAASSTGAIDRIALFVYRLETMQTDAPKPLLLALLDPDREQPIPKGMVVNIIDDVESWLVRRMLYRAGTKSYSRLFADLVNIVRTSPVESLHERIRETLQRQRGDATFWPDDKDIRSSLSVLPLYKRMSVSRNRMILEAIEDYLRGVGSHDKKFTEESVRRGVLSIEHLMPQAWERNWPEPADGDFNARFQRIHSLGNLTLVTRQLNTSVSNGSWESKSQALNRYGVLLLNSTLSEYQCDGWSDEAILKRTDALTDIVLQIWSVPPGHSSERSTAAVITNSNVSLLDLLKDHVLHEGQLLKPTMSSYEQVNAIVIAGGKLLCQDSVFDTPSGAAVFVRGGRATNGWLFWAVDSADGVTLAELRHDLLRRRFPDEYTDAHDDNDEAQLQGALIVDMQQRFWQGFRQYVADNGLPFTPGTPRGHKLNIPLGMSDARLYAVMTTFTFQNIDNGPELRVEFYIPDNHALYDRLFDQRDAIEAAYQSQLTWHYVAGTKSTRICDHVKRDVTDETQWSRYYEWLTEHIVRLRDAIVPRIP